MTSGLQFGFKKKMSTSLCTGTVKNIVSHYMFCGSSVFACFLNASKAFDLVNHGILFKRLLDRDMPHPLVRFLLSWYQSQFMSVRWGDCLSAPFSVSNGVRQGGILSPILFTIYLDDLLTDLSNLRVGCFWGSMFAGALCYADDLVLLAPSPSALRIMLRFCESFALERGLHFNASKTQLIRFSSSPSSACAARFHLCGSELPFLDSVVHLGHLISYNLDDSPDVNSKLRDMIRKANCLLASFPGIGPAILSRLFQSYCLVRVSGPCLLLLYAILRWHLTKFCVRSGACIIVVTQQLYILLRIYLVSSMLCSTDVILCVLLLRNVLPLWFVLFSVTLLLFRTLSVVIIPCMAHPT